MTRYIGFLRAINVGGHTVKMDRLRSLFAELGFTNVESFIASGNVIFESQMDDTAALERSIEHHLKASLGYDVATFLRTPAQLAAIAEYEPFSKAELASEGNTLYVTFLPGPPERGPQERLVALRNEIDDFRVHMAEAYWLRRRNVGESTFTGALLEKTMGTPATMRNMNTVRRLVAKYPPDVSVGG